MYIEPLTFVGFLALFGLIGVLAAIAGFLNEIRKHYEEELRAQLARRRHTYATAEGIEDARGVGIDVQRAIRMAHEAEDKMTAAVAALAYIEVEMDQLEVIHKRLREGPLAYKPPLARKPPRPRADHRGRQ
jgi:uncharacterized BrkB/YihY/UPF0761 family membrane protein